MPNDNLKEVSFLIVDDDAISVRSMQRAVKKMKLINDVHVAGDGIEALEVLRGENGNEGLQPPFIIILDLNMPRMNGLEFLEELRNDPALASAIVFVLTTSDATPDVTAAYAKNIAGYVVKEEAYETFCKMLDMLDCYAKLVVLPETV